jgi:hypothetical protein
MEDNEKENFWQMFEGVKMKLDNLPSASYIKSALTPELLASIMKKIQNECLEDLRWGYWPPIFLYVDRYPVENIIKLDEDIDLLVKHSKNKSKSDISNFLKSNEDGDRRWMGGLFEVYFKTRVLNFFNNDIIFDEPLPNGKQPDIKVKVSNKIFYIEGSVLTDSDDDRQVYNRFLEYKKTKPNAVLGRPGEYDSKNPIVNSPYYDTIRFYLKVFDKLAPNLDTSKSQLSDNSPNILLISFNNYIGTTSVSSPDLGWGLDELFSAQPRLSEPFGVSLSCWLDFYANELSSKSMLSLNKYCEHYNELITSPMKISTILVFRGSTFKFARINYNAQEECKISHQELITLEKIFENSPEWYSE